MEDRKFDALAKALGAKASRRSLLKGVLGVGGPVVTGSVLHDRAEAARRGYSGPRFPWNPPPTSPPDLCADVSCTTPPNSLCYASTGTCNPGSGACEYPPLGTDTVCGDCLSCDGAGNCNTPISTCCTDIFLDCSASLACCSACCLNTQANTTQICQNAGVPAPSVALCAEELSGLFEAEGQTCTPPRVIILGISIELPCLAT